ncbi:MAG: replication-associated recombination protein A [bacterium]|nr:replication-associated recombination protein A [bacterium]
MQPDDPQSGASQTADRHIPLADRMRPASLHEVVGQDDLLGPNGPLGLLLKGDNLPSLLLWGPPGCGKTTLARLVAQHTQARFLEYSAVSVGSKELKAVMGESAKLKQVTGQRTLLFLDEIHRFNKAQQDALLPWVERGDVTLIGATTENPSFEVNSALISRTRLFVLQPLQPSHVTQLLRRALDDPRGLNIPHLTLDDDALTMLSDICEGDARAALGLLETVGSAYSARQEENPEEENKALTAADIGAIIQNRASRYDKGGEEHFNIISALHKSMRNSDVQAALYWLGRMIEGGEDPLYIARRLVRFASEDVGLADPQALVQTLAARDAIHFIGLPEGALALSQAVVYLALCPKSNALYKGYKLVQKEVAKGYNPGVPMHIRNAPTQLMKGLGYGKGYAYAHDRQEGITEMTCLPDSLQGETYYEPGRRGFEAELSQRMEQIKKWHRKRRQASQPSEGEKK